MLRPGTQSDYIDRRINLPTAKSHADIVRDLEPKIKAQAFFSARVAEARILERLRSVTDAYSRGEMGLGEARNILKDFLKAEGYDPHQAGLRNLAGTARLNLILKQSAAMTHAAAEWKRMHDPDAMKVFPYVRYHASVGSKVPRSTHQKYDGMIFRKDDPFLKTHTPPWDFKCRCQLEEITEKEAQRHAGMIQEPTPADKVTIDSESGFVFDPEHAFEEFDCSVIQRAGMMGKVREEAEIEFGSQISFKNGKASFEDKGFHTFEDEGRGSALLWKNENLPQAPGEYSVEKAKKMLQAGTKVDAATGETVVFDNECLQHWQKTAKNEKEINARLTFLPMAISTVTAPLEVWNQGLQMGFIKAFKKASGGYRGCLVFVTPETSKVRTYFLKDLKALDKARKGFAVQTFDQKKDGTD